ncbi:mothers against decapentaplegic homolog 6-like [Daktulosphaira vitifoliae]|uniref:mothers against decapentaplegic homolog 6-like n=1 Tax=Daktulosphaira vitifoliae TaxID=58002 RepID=UPI0021AAEE42|nr:mothers against decapentaplegic homolog 6-like [Daktulosphaira vitifoliae]
MFMFRRRRTALAKRLWKARVRRDNETRCAEKTVGQPPALSPGPDSDERQFRNALFKRLDDRQLETLLRAVDTVGADAAECVAVRPFLFADPAVICCRLWRWPDLKSAEQLKATPACQQQYSSTGLPDLVCCNPYHWSKRCEIERPPPPYSRFIKEKLKPEDRAPSECSWDSNDDELRGSFSTDGDEKPNEKEWCKVAYWELSQRVGRLYPVDTKSVNVFWNVPIGTGLSLAALTQHNYSPTQQTPDSVLRNRTKIGQGLALSREDDGVWAYNLSDWPMFVNSPTLDDPDSRSYLVFRVPSGHCLNIFTGNPHGDRIRYSNGLRVGPVDPNAVRISFAKGWGPKYSRQEITSCPTWIEVLLDPCR